MDASDSRDSRDKREGRAGATGDARDGGWLCLACWRVAGVLGLGNDEDGTVYYLFSTRQGAMKGERLRWVKDWPEIIARRQQ